MRDHPSRPALVVTAALASLWLATPPTPLLAEDPQASPPAAAPRADAKEAREKVREVAQEVREKVTSAKQEAREKLDAAKDEARRKLDAAKQEAHEKMKAAHEELKAARDDAKVKMGAVREELREELHEKVDQVLGPPEARAARAREHRRHEMRALRPHWKRGADIPPEVREALRKHARRSARLMRIRALAEAKGDTKSVERCDKLLALEREHHHARMGRLVPRTAAPAAPAAAPAEPPEAEDDERAAEEEEEQP